jgi:uncharacterized protein (TIGR03118 family)
MFRLALAAAALACAFVAGPAAARTQNDIYSVQDLAADTATSAPTTDSNLVNGWGLSAGPTTPWWASNNGTNTTTLYNGSGAKQALTVSVPGAPTGTVFNGNASDFLVSQNGKSGSAKFLFATEAGTILGWSSTVNATTALPGVDRSSQSAVYKGLTTTNDRLYATDFHNGRVDVFDASFNPVPLAGFKDKKVPKGFAPFGIQALGGNVYVTYAKQDGAKKDDVAGGGLGYVDEFTPDGALVARVAAGGRKNAPPNAPWGLALAPSTFGAFAGDLLVGNFGNGRIHAYRWDGHDWEFAGTLRGTDHRAVVVDGLWAIAFGGGAANNGPTNTLFFAAGPNDESAGAFGTITVAP